MNPASRGPKLDVGVRDSGQGRRLSRSVRNRRPGGCPGFLVWALILGWTSLVGGAWGAEPVRPVPEYAAWREACRRLPYNRQLGERLAPREVQPLRTFVEFKEVLDAFLEQCRTGALSRVEGWLEEPPRGGAFFDLDRVYHQGGSAPFRPFAQRHAVPAGTRVFVHGDLHGDIHSLMAYLDGLQQEGHLAGFRLVRSDSRMVFLGDYTDRGRYGVEVMYTLLRLRLENPEQVLLVRGNHEDASLIARYGFLAEAYGKFGKDFDARRVSRLYEFLPAVLYLACGTNVVQCNHGGLEPGFSPGRLLDAASPVEFQWLGRLTQRRLLTAGADWVKRLPSAHRRQLEAGLMDFVPETPTTPTVLGFMWNDFTVVTGESQFAVDPGRAFVYGDQATRTVFELAGSERHRIRSMFRGHQHSGVLDPMMRRLVASDGVFRHWQSGDAAARLNAPPDELRGTLETDAERAIPDGSVWTFNVSPDSVYGAGCGFGFDTAGELVTAERWEDWRLRVRNVRVVP